MRRRGTFLGFLLGVVTADDGVWNSEVVSMYDRFGEGGGVGYGFRYVPVLSTGVIFEIFGLFDTTFRLFAC